MLFAKILFPRLKTNIFAKLVRCQNSNAFLRWNFKVNQYCTADIMEDILDPPKSVKGMKVLDRSAFKKTITVPCLEVKSKNLPAVINLLKSYFLKMVRLNQILPLDDDNRKILLNPLLVNEWTDFNENTTNELQKLQISIENFSKMQLELNYENWSANSCIKAILPNDNFSFRSFSIIGHIVHLNLKDNLLDYKYIIADIILDKIHLTKTVLYKKNKIDNVYRNFELEIIRGEDNFNVSVKENGSIFEFDFSKVYWNPRLGTEHERIHKSINLNDVLFDVFAGVGPFAIPVAKKKIYVYANDLNPESFKWLNHNIEINKKCKNYIQTFNKDGGDFILNEVKLNLIKIWQNKLFNGKIHIVMNLPALAPTFIKYFKGLITESDTLNLDLDRLKKFLLSIHCYFFASESENERVVFEQMSGLVLNEIEHNFFYVRGVSTTKNMHRITFQLPSQYLLAAMENNDSDDNEPLTKRICKN